MMRFTWLKFSLGLLLALVFSATSLVQADTLTGEASIPLESSPTTEPVAPVDPTDPDQPYLGKPGAGNQQETGSVQALSLDYISNFHFEEQQVSRTVTAKLTNRNPMVQISDTRGNNAGWVLQLKSNSLQGTHTKTTISTGQLNLGKLVLRTKTGNVSRVPEVVSQQLNLNDYINLVRAKPGQGSGLWTVGFNQVPTAPTSLQLTLPATVPSDHYVGQLDWLLLDAPN